MPNDQKKRWRVSTWGTSAERLQLAQSIEATLNAMATDNYEIYEVNYEKEIAIGRLDPSHETPAVEVSSLGEMLGSLFGRGRSPSEAPEEAPPQQDPLVIRGVLTHRLLNGIQAAAMVQAFGDPTGERRIEKMIQELFKQAPRIEVERSIEDVKQYHLHHTKSQCSDPECVHGKLMILAQQRLEAQLSEKPLS